MKIIKSKTWSHIAMRGNISHINSDLERQLMTCNSRSCKEVLLFHIIIIIIIVAVIITNINSILDLTSPKPQNIITKYIIAPSYILPLHYLRRRHCNLDHWGMCTMHNITNGTYFITRPELCTLHQLSITKLPTLRRVRTLQLS